MKGTDRKELLKMLQNMSHLNTKIGTVRASMKAFQDRLAMFSQECNKRPSDHVFGELQSEAKEFNLNTLYMVATLEQFEQQLTDNALAKVGSDNAR